MRCRSAGPSRNREVETQSWGLSRWAHVLVGVDSSSPRGSCAGMACVPDLEDLLPVDC